ncbi:MAG: hypothetical protein AB7P03_12130 [Kofleriaceae bacterium]
MTSNEHAPRSVDEPPPFWSRWSRIYVFVAVLLVIEAIAFWIVTRWAS